MVQITLNPRPVQVSFDVTDIVSHDVKNGVGVLKLSASITKSVTDKITDTVSISNDVVSDKSIELPCEISDTFMQDVVSDIEIVQGGGTPSTFTVDGEALYDSDAKLKVSPGFTYTYDGAGEPM